MPLLLGVNIDHIATLRQARYAKEPDSSIAEPCPVHAGQDAVAGGADSLTIHVRGDRRHMQDADAFRIRSEIKVPLNPGEMIGNLWDTISKWIGDRFNTTPQKIPEPAIP